MKHLKFATVYSLSLVSSKTKEFNINPSLRPTCNSIALTLEIVNEYKYLGIMIDSKLLWNTNEGKDDSVKYYTCFE